MSLSNNLLNTYENASKALNYCNESLMLQGSEPANSLYDVGNKILTISSNESSQISPYKQILEKSITSLTENNLAGVTNIREYLFYNCENLTTFIPPNGLIYLGIEAFKNCSNLINVKLPNSLTTIDESCFQNCGFTIFEIPINVNSVGDRVLNKCSQLKTLIISGNIGTIPQYFCQVTNLQKLIINVNQEINLSSTGAFKDTPLREDGNGIIYVPNEKLSWYQTAPNWTYFSNQIQGFNDISEIDLEV